VNALAGEWLGANPFFLVITTPGVGQTVIDLDQPGWVSKNAELMRLAGAWMLNHKKTGTTATVILVDDGEQPYYTARHIGVAFGGAGEIVAYGIGKKRRDGHVDRLWVFENGIVCAGDDVENLALAFVRARGQMSTMTTGSLGRNAEEVKTMSDEAAVAEEPTEEAPAEATEESTEEEAEAEAEPEAEA
jgi:hypothetical protein